MDNFSKIIQLVKNSSLKDRNALIEEIKEKGFTLELKERILRELDVLQSQYLRSSQKIEKLLAILNETNNDIAAVDQNSNLKITQMAQKANADLEYLKNK